MSSALPQDGSGPAGAEEVKNSSITAARQSFFKGLDGSFTSPPGGSRIYNLVEKDLGFSESGCKGLLKGAINAITAGLWVNGGEEKKKQPGTRPPPAGRLEKQPFT